MDRLDKLYDNQAILPKSEGYSFPAEWGKHRATWLTLPLNDESWPGKMEAVYDCFFQFIRIISLSEKVAINVQNESLAEFVKDMAADYHIPQAKIECHMHPSNDCWARDHGPVFLRNEKGEKLIVNWEFNAWGNKYAYNLDNQIPQMTSTTLGIPIVDVNIVVEGGAVECNGAGTLITTRSCLLNPNRNAGLSPSEIESILMNYYGVEKVLWLEEGITGDDTDGHIDTICRFVSEDTVVTMIAHDRSDPDYLPLKKNRDLLSGFSLADGRKFNIIEIPMPEPVYHNGLRLPASYANFYITNRHVVVPVFNTGNDEVALDTLCQCFPTRKVIGIDSNILIRGLGSFHCLSQQEPV